MKRRLPSLFLTGVVGGLLLIDLLTYRQSIAWARYFFFKGRASIGQAAREPRPVDIRAAATCREQLRQIQAAKRKVAQQRGVAAGPISYDDLLRALARYPARRVAPHTLHQYFPRCPAGGTYTIGNLEQAPRCSLAGQGTVRLDDDHVVWD